MASAVECSLVIDLAVDTSAVLAVLLREPIAEAVLERLCQAVQPALAAPTRTEVLLVALVKLGEVGQERAREFLDQQAVLTVAWDQELADQAAEAFARFGRGRHASGLNFGDCFSYALAKRWKVPLLFVGNDFSRTDLEVAL
ncbi:MAG: type II toxin-antitoxin system VapC family toxin [Cyanobacteriota bacterium]|nr:type II toxin-antitoxin system VapC family toxin [Cyanobacteriota bacterium]